MGSHSNFCYFLECSVSSQSHPGRLSSWSPGLLWQEFMLLGHTELSLWGPSLGISTNTDRLPRARLVCLTPAGCTFSLSYPSGIPPGGCHTGKFTVCEVGTERQIKKSAPSNERQLVFSSGRTLSFRENTKICRKESCLQHREGGFLQSMWDTCAVPHETPSKLYVFREEGRGQQRPDILDNVLGARMLVAASVGSLMLA